MDSTELICKAAALAVRWHGGQMRRGNVVPYITHPARVVELLMSAVNDLGIYKIMEEKDKAQLYAAAWLHDTIEDCNISRDNIIQEFGKDGPRIATLVMEVTNPSTFVDYDKYSRKERKAMDLEHIAKASADGKLIKLCDRLDNIRDLVTGCDDEYRRQRYKKETLQLMDVLDGVYDPYSIDIHRTLEKL